MKTFEYNWATAEMIKMYLRNSHAQEARRARLDTESSTGTQEVPTVDPGLMAAGSGAGVGSSDINSLDSETESDENADE